MSMRVGIDLVSVESVRDSVNMHGEHYLRRIYTERELQDCSTPTGVNPERLAARFAAKEATLKVLRPDEQGIPWNAIEVRRHPSGWVDLEAQWSRRGARRRSRRHRASAEHRA